MSTHQMPAMVQRALREASKKSLQIAQALSKAKVQGQVPTEQGPQQLPMDKRLLALLHKSE